MNKLKLTVNETKTRVCKLPEEKFDFLGCTQRDDQNSDGTKRKPTCIRLCQSPANVA